MLTEVLRFIPGDSDGKLALDVGAGTGRDAAWLTSLGYEVAAAEPAAGLRRIAAAKHAGDGISWVSDALPSLDHVHGLGLASDLVLLSTVWQQVAPAERPRVFRKLAMLMKPSGLLVMTLRHGPTPSPAAMAEPAGAALDAVRHANFGVTQS